MLFIRSLLTNMFVYGFIGLGCIAGSVTGIFYKQSVNFIFDKIAIPCALFCARIFGGIKIEYRGKEHIKQHGVIYASKHESALETYCYNIIINRIAFILKKELTYIPFFGWAQYFYGTIPVDRKAGGAAMRKMLKAAEKMKEAKRAIMIFPEGTRCKPGTTKGYKSGPYLLAKQLKMPIIPVALNTGFFWAKNSFFRYAGTVIIEFMPPIEVGEKSSAEFMQELEDIIENKCAELNEETAKKYPHAQKMMANIKKTC